MVTYKAVHTCIPSALQHIKPVHTLPCKLLTLQEAMKPL